MAKIELFIIGGSAGALEPLLEILSGLTPELTMPIAIVLHLNPSHPSLLSGLLARTCNRPVSEPDDKQPLASGAIYVAPPNYHLLVERDRTLSLSVDELVHFSRPSIDVLFESAADAFGSEVVALVLSGSNADGAEGLRRIAEAGGVALVQSEASASYPTMPAAAAARVPDAQRLAPGEVVGFISRLVGRTPQLEQTQ
ncbi:MAG: chemotaxis protein CheB [Kofleriaceae bacterium]